MFNSLFVLGLLVVVSNAATFHPHHKEGWIRHPTKPTFYLDHCKEFGADCDAPAADLFCQMKGFAKSAGSEFKNVVAGDKTLMLSDTKQCDGTGCGAFTKIVCHGHEHTIMAAGSDKWIRYPGDPKYFLDHCATFGAGCDYPTATNQACKAFGFEGSVSSTFANVAASDSTKILGDQRTCAGAGCGAFTKLVCTGRLPTFHPHHGDRAIRFPHHFLDHCYMFGAQCDQPAADAFCKLKGFGTSVRSTFVNVANDEKNPSIGR